MSRQSILILAWILVACHCRQGAQALAADAPNSPPAALDQASIDGLSFIVESRNPQDHQKSANSITNINTNTNNKQQQIDNDLESIFRQDNSKRSSLRVDLLDGSGKHPMNQRDLWRMTRLDQVLEELSSSIPPARQQQLFQQQQQAPASPLHRSSRTYPSSAAPFLIDQSIGRAGPQVSPMMAAAANGDLFGGRMLAFPIKSSDQPEQWQQQQQQQQTLGGTSAATLQQQLFDNGLVTRPVSVPVKGRKPAAGLLGILWSPTRPNGGSANGGGVGGGNGVSNGAGPTPYYSALQQSQSLQSGSGISGAKKSQSPPQQSRLLSPGASISGQPGGGGGGGSGLLGPLTSASAASSPHHRSGTEEFALHTPIHSQSASDYEWKRVENSRWNNLRGMWGKRAINERYNDLNNFKEMLESEARDLLRTTAAANNGYTSYGLLQNTADVDNLGRSSSLALQQRHQQRNSQQPAQSALIVPM